jgi:protein tyrosine/serine phosphatase
LSGERWFAHADGLPTAFQIIEFALVVEDADNAPLLIHCGSANRVGDMWALYRALKGIPDEIALEKARTIGLQPDREADVRT